MIRAIALAAGLVLAAPAAGWAAGDKAGPLLDALGRAPTEQQAAVLEQKVQAVWHDAVSPAVQLLADRAVEALAKEDPSTAIGDLDAALDLQPEQALLWRLHAEARFANGDSNGATADLAQALSREPRCFPALADLSHVAEASGNFARALKAWQRLLAIDPKVQHGAARLMKLESLASGQAL